MRSLCSFCGIVAVFAGLAMAEDWTGKLMDAACYDQNKTAKPCDATSTTTQFVFDVNGKIYKLDATGNAKAAEAIKSRADRAEPGKPSNGAVNAKVSGTAEGDTLKVNMLEVQ
jgi:hypothetical protein